MPTTLFSPVISRRLASPTVALPISATRPTGIMPMVAIPDIPPPAAVVDPQDAAAIMVAHDESTAQLQRNFEMRRFAISSGIGGAVGAGTGALIGKLAGNTKKGAVYGVVAGAVLPMVSEKARMGVMLIAMVLSGGMPRY